MDKHKGEIVEYELLNLSKLKAEIFDDYGERKYKIISILPRKEKDVGFSSYSEYYLVYVKLGSTFEEIEEKKIAKKNKKKELLDLINSIYNFVLPEEKKKEIAFLKEKENKAKQLEEKAQKLKEAEEFRRRNNPTLEERKEDLQKAKDNAREVTESLRYLRPQKEVK